MKVETHLSFEGQCEEALIYYQQLLNIEVSMLMRFADSPDPGLCPPNSDNKVMHANFKIGDTAFMASDGQCSGNSNFAGFALSFNAETEAEGERIFTAFAQEGRIIKPLANSFWGGLYGEVSDKFGLTWMISVFS